MTAMAMMALPTTVQSFDAAVDRRMSMGIDAQVEGRVQLAKTSESARATIDARVTEGFQSEAFRVALETRTKPELRALETQTAQPIANVGTKIDEIEAIHVELDRRLGSSTAARGHEGCGQRGLPGPDRLGRGAPAGSRGRPEDC